MTTNPARSKCCTTRAAGVAGIYSAASCFRLRSSNRSAKAIELARSRASAGVKLSARSRVIRALALLTNEWKDRADG